jgi:hypothetical protein
MTEDATRGTTVWIREKLERFRSAIRKAAEGGSKHLPSTAGSTFSPMPSASSSRSKRA